MSRRQRSIERDLETLQDDIGHLRGLVVSGVHVRSQAVATMFSRHSGERAAACAQAWNVVAQVGAPVGELLDACEAALVADHRREHAIRAAIAGPLLATRLLLLLPVVSTGVMTALGFDCVGVLLGQPIGWVCCGLACALVMTARAWTNRLVARARMSRVLPGLVLDLAAVGVMSGVGMRRLLGFVTAQPWFRDDERRYEVAEVRALNRDCAAWGIPLERLLRGSAKRERDRASVASERRTAELAEKVLLPVGVCVLPAFMLLVAVPAVVSTLSGTALLST